MGAVQDFLIRFKGQSASLDRASDKARVNLKKVDKQAKKTGGSIGKMLDGVRSADGNLLKMAGSLSIAGGAFAAAAVAATVFVGAMVNVADRFDELSKSARGAGVSVEFLSEVRFAAQLAGTDIQGMNKALVTLSDRLSQAKDGSKLMANAFADLRIDPKQFESIEDLLPVLADRFAELGPGIDRTALAVRLFGARLGRQMIPLLIEGSEKLEQARQGFRNLGGTVSTDAAQSAEKFNDALTVLGVQFNIIVEKSVGPYIESIGNLLTAYNDVILKTGDFSEAIGAAFDVFATGFKADAVQGYIDTLQELVSVFGIFSGEQGNFITQALEGYISDARDKLKQLNDEIAETSKVGRPKEENRATGPRGPNAAEQQRIAAEAVKAEAAAKKLATSRAAAAKKLADARLRVLQAQANSDALARRAKFEAQLLDVERDRLQDSTLTYRQYYDRIERLQVGYFADERGRQNVQSAALAELLAQAEKRTDDAGKLEAEKLKQQLIKLNDVRAKFAAQEDRAALSTTSARFGAEESEIERLADLRRELASVSVDPAMLDFQARITELRKQELNATAEEIELLKQRATQIGNELALYQRNTQARAEVIRVDTQIVNIEAQLARGALTTYEAEIAINKALDERLAKELALLETQRARSNNPEEIAGFDQQIAQLHAAQEGLTNAEQEFKNAFTSNVSTFVSSIVQDTQSGTDALRNMLTGFLQFFADRIGRDLSEELYKSMVDGAKRGSNGAKGEATSLAASLVDIFSQAGNALSGLFGGVVGGADASIAAQAAGAADGGLATSRGIQKHVPRYANGGAVKGPGTKTSDSILARISAGEFVQPSKAVDHYGPGVMESIRRLAIPRDVLRKLSGLNGSAALQNVRNEASRYSIPGFATGGMVPAGSQPQGFGDALNNITIENRGSPQRVTSAQQTYEEQRGMVLRIFTEDWKDNGPMRRQQDGGR